MSIAVRGMGWATPFGRDLSAVFAQIEAGGRPEPSILQNPFNQRQHPIFKVPPDCLEDVERLPRLRRSSTISLAAMAAAQDALANAGIEAVPECLALLFAATDGGVIYTRKFFAEIAKHGLQAGSPLLFPETVYNAPASHIAARWNLTGTASAIVSDATAAIGALKMAEDLIESGECDDCLVVAAEETDWIICEAYRRWRFGKGAAAVEPYSGKGTVFADGASALVVSRTGSFPLPRIHPGRSYKNLHDAAQSHATVLADLDKTGEARAIFASAAGTRFDAIEKTAIEAALPKIPCFTPKISLGEAFAASALAQVVCAALWLKTQPARTSAIVSVIGCNGQTSGLTLSNA